MASLALILSGWNGCGKETGGCWLHQRGQPQLHVRQKYKSTTAKGDESRRARTPCQDYDYKNAQLARILILPSPSIIYSGLAMCKDERPMSAAAHSPQGARLLLVLGLLRRAMSYTGCSTRSADSPNRLTAADGLAPGAF
ncbi:hypothetical protein TGAM01_v201176 [Trichoderma gamsii]|uniref:Uncharacterized protein n=1 Tax=Trichoderma gamsii TaxID=398673 RepID=A0A2P4ZZT5_9HYPO|nr:hypothetical protein TGAM01_v201176 [Trichoderma gamsii]PON29810.1 hypothetical protein TGAM01_v201176 [Trichoderma gamsii]